MSTNGLHALMDLSIFYQAKHVVTAYLAQHVSLVFIVGQRSTVYFVLVRPFELPDLPNANTHFR